MLSFKDFIKEDFKGSVETEFDFGFNQHNDFCVEYKGANGKVRIEPVTINDGSTIHVIDRDNLDLSTKATIEDAIRNFLFKKLFHNSMSKKEDMGTCVKLAHEIMLKGLFYELDTNPDLAKRIVAQDSREGEIADRKQHGISSDSDLLLTLNKPKDMSFSPRSRGELPTPSKVAYIKPNLSTSYRV